MRLMARIPYREGVELHVDLSWEGNLTPQVQKQQSRRLLAVACLFSNGMTVMISAEELAELAPYVKPRIRRLAIPDREREKHVVMRSYFRSILTSGSPRLKRALERYVPGSLDETRDYVSITSGDQEYQVQWAERFHPTRTG